MLVHHFHRRRPFHTAHVRKRFSHRDAAITNDNWSRPEVAILAINKGSTQLPGSDLIYGIYCHSFT
jgi:hypothetical protein